VNVMVAIESAAVGLNGGTFLILRGDKLTSDHPAVLAHPGKFVSVVEPSVESAEEPKRRGRANG